MRWRRKRRNMREGGEGIGRKRRGKRKWRKRRQWEITDEYNKEGKMVSHKQKHMKRTNRKGGIKKKALTLVQNE